MSDVTMIEVSPLEEIQDGREVLFEIKLIGGDGQSAFSSIGFEVRRGGYIAGWGEGSLSIAQRRVEGRTGLRVAVTQADALEVAAHAGEVWGTWSSDQD